MQAQQEQLIPEEYRQDEFDVNFKKVKTGHMLDI